MKNLPLYSFSVGEKQEGERKTKKNEKKRERKTNKSEIKKIEAFSSPFVANKLNIANKLLPIAFRADSLKDYESGIAVRERIVLIFSPRTCDSIREKANCYTSN